MVLNYHAANYSGWPLSRFIIMLQSYKNYLNYANISATFFTKNFNYFESIVF
jgi:hypothetical protein